LEEADVIVDEDCKANQAVKGIECDSKIDLNVILFGCMKPDCGKTKCCRTKISYDKPRIGATDDSVIHTSIPYEL
jgi:hypothetical protein